VTTPWQGQVCPARPVAPAADKIFSMVAAPQSQPAAAI
jgi:hypothetical protein